MDTRLNILVVEDHEALREVTLTALRNAGHSVQGVDSAAALDGGMAHQHFDLLVLDLNLPGEDGLSLARRIRSSQPEVCIIMVTARSSLQDRLDGYGSGADIYLTKPTSMDELLAAVSALSRRIVRPATSGELRLDMKTHTLHGPNGAVELSGAEIGLLSIFARAYSHQVSYAQLLGLGGREDDAATAGKGALEVQIVRLRKKLVDIGTERRPIRSIRGYGYQLCIPLVVG